MGLFTKLTDSGRHFLKCLRLSRSIMWFNLTTALRCVHHPHFADGEAETRGVVVTCQVPTASQWQSCEWNPSLCSLYRAWLVQSPTPGRASLRQLQFFPSISQIWEFSELQNCFLIFKKFILFIYFWLALGLRCCARPFSSCGEQASHCGGFSCCGAWALGMWASVVVARGLSCSAACGIFPDQGSNRCPLHWQADS